MKLFQRKNILKLIVDVRHYSSQKEPQSKYDAVIIGAGHNGLVCAAYLQKAGCKVCVLERRHVVGGAAVTEEIIPGYKFSRASYVLSLLRPQIYADLQLEKYGFKVFPRDPNLYTPIRPELWKDSKAHSLTLGRNSSSNIQQIAKFSVKDAKIFQKYEEHLSRLVAAVEPILDVSPSDIKKLLTNKSVIKNLIFLLQSHQLRNAGASILSLGNDFPALWDLMTAPASKVLSRWFESEPLRATLATDAVIGSMISPMTPGSGYVLMHHMMGQLHGVRGAWGYPQGGMGSLTQVLATICSEKGVHIVTNKNVSSIILNNSKEAVGVTTDDGKEILASVVLSNATPYITFFKLLSPGALPPEFEESIKSIDYNSGVTKINVALDSLPNFVSDPCLTQGKLMPHHQCTINLNCESIDILNDAYESSLGGKISERPLIEMVIPSSLDTSLCPTGHHVCLLFTQYTPYHRSDGRTWDKKTKEEYAQKVFANIEEYAPGFTNSIIGKEVLSPVDLEEEFGLTGGNIFHGALSPDQLLFGRPAPGCPGDSAAPYTPISRLLLCGSGSHPGGGVMGSAGMIAAKAAQLIVKYNKQ